MKTSCFDFCFSGTQRTHGVDFYDVDIYGTVVIRLLGTVGAS
jgi:hypothetical protein